jgi:formylmethanofuran dehydrogenase subunit B
MADLKCPYCGKECSDNNCEYYEEDQVYEHQCPNCEMYFQVFVSYTKYYSEHQCPCLNGEEHKLVKATGYPKEYYENRYRCEYCGEEIIKQPDHTGG